MDYRCDSPFLYVGCYFIRLRLRTVIVGAITNRPLVKHLILAKRAIANRPYRFVDYKGLTEIIISKCLP